MREEYIGWRKGEIEWGKLSIIKGTRESFFNGEGKGEVKGKSEAYSLYFWLKEGITYTLNLV